MTRAQPGAGNPLDAAAAPHAGLRMRKAWSAASRVSWALVDQCVVSAANFLTVLLFARHLGTADFGAFMLAHTGLFLLTGMQNALVTQPHNVLGARLERGEYRRFTGALVVMQAATAVVICGALGIAGWVVAAWLSPPAGGVLMMLALAAAPWLGQEFVRRVLYTRSESRPAALNDFITYGLQLAGAYVLTRFWADRASPELALLVLGGSSLAGALVGVWQLRAHVCIRGGVVRGFGRAWSQAWHFGKWLTAQNALLWLGSHGHAWVVGILLGAEQVGLYRAATHIANVMNPLRQAAYSYLPSRGSVAYQRGAAGGLSRWVRRMLVVLVVALAPFLVLLVGFPGWVLDLAYGARYADAELALILALATIGQCITFSKFPFDVGLMSMGATRSIFLVHLIPVALLFTAGAALIAWLGIMGVPLSAILINTVLLGATWAAYARRIARRPARGER